MKTSGSYKGQQPQGGWDNRAVTKRMVRAERDSERPRFNNRPAPEGTLPVEKQVMHVQVISV
jgi:hypothetical protein